MHDATVALHRINLQRGCVIGHDDVCRTPIHPRSQGQCRTVVSGRMGCNIAADARFAKPGHGIAGATKLERSGALQVFTLAQQITAQFAIETVTGVNRCAMHQVLDALVRRAHGRDVWDER